MSLFGIKLNKGLVILNTLETAGLAIWLALVNSGAALFGPMAGAILFLFLLAEHIVGFNNFNKFNLFDIGNVPITKLGVITALETLVWIVWLKLTMGAGLLISAAVLLVGLAIHHVTEMNVFRGKSAFSRFGDLVQAGFGFTLIETVTGIIWLALTKVNSIIAIVVLFIGLLVEHNKSTDVMLKLDE